MKNESSQIGRLDITKLGLVTKPPKVKIQGTAGI